MEDRILTYDVYIQNSYLHSISELSRLVAIPSVSAYQQQQAECAQMVKSMLLKRGFAVELLGHLDQAPVVVGFKKGRIDKTLLIYNHYDVQPVEPLELWTHPPFEPIVIDNLLFGRGVNDDKGHFTDRLLALDALLTIDGELPCNILWVVEGEEETTSQTLGEVIKDHPGKFTADACIWEFGSINENDQPLLHLGLRGICYVELSVTTANQDIHSGIGGSIMHNAAWRLVWALRSLKGKDENVRIAGFYNKVRPVSSITRKLIDALPDNAPIYRKQYGITSFLKGISGGSDLWLAEAHEPSCTICGITSGYQGPGPKTIVPATASAKVDFRLVPDQNPEEILELLRAHLDTNGFDDIKIELIAKEFPSVTDPDHPFVRMVAETARDVFGMPMLMVPSIGGTGPSAKFLEYYNFPIVTVGIGHPTMQMHAPDENLRLDLYIKGAQQIARILKRFPSLYS